MCSNSAQLVNDFLRVIEEMQSVARVYGFSHKLYIVLVGDAVCCLKADRHKINQTSHVYRLGMLARARRCLPLFVGLDEEVRLGDELAAIEAGFRLLKAEW